MTIFPNPFFLILENFLLSVKSKKFHQFAFLIYLGLGFLKGN